MEDTELIQTEDITYPPIEKGWLERSAHIVSLVFNPFICDALWLHLSKDAAGIL